MNNVKRNNFKLKQVKLLHGLGVHTESKLTVISNNKYKNINHKDDSDIIPSESLSIPIRDLKNELLTSSGHLLLKAIVRDPGFKATDDQKKISEKFISILKDRIVINGISLTGKDENRGCMIMATFTADNGVKTSVNSPKMRFESDVYGFESDLESVCELIEDEVYKYLFEGKCLEPTVF